MMNKMPPSPQDIHNAIAASVNVYGALLTQQELQIRMLEAEVNGLRTQLKTNEEALARLRVNAVPAMDAQDADTVQERRVPRKQ